MNKLAAILMLVMPMGAQSQPMDHSAMARSSSGAEMSFDPKEPGQSAYAAIGEIVRILVANPKTDWNNVDVDALRSHLVDMDDVTLHSTVTTARLPDGARFAVRGTGGTVAAIQRMTASHFATQDVESHWKMVVQSTGDGADVIVTSSVPGDSTKIAALGFFGILTMGAHHQPHHLMMAQGAMKH